MSQFCKEKIFKINFAKAPSQERSQPSGLDTHPPYRAAQPETRGIHHRYRRDHNFATAAPALPGAERRRRRRRRRCPAAYRPDPPPAARTCCRAPPAASRARHSPRRPALPASERRGRPAAVRAGQDGGRGSRAGRAVPRPPAEAAPLRHRRAALPLLRGDGRRAPCPLRCGQVRGSPPASPRPVPSLAAAAAPSSPAYLLHRAALCPQRAAAAEQIQPPPCPLPRRLGARRAALSHPAAPDPRSPAGAARTSSSFLLLAGPRRAARGSPAPAGTGRTRPPLSGRGRASSRTAPAESSHRPLCLYNTVGLIPLTSRTRTAARPRGGHFVTRAATPRPYRAAPSPAPGVPSTAALGPTGRGRQWHGWEPRTAPHSRPPRFDSGATRWKSGGVKFPLFLKGLQSKEAWSAG